MSRLGLVARLPLLIAALFVAAPLHAATLEGKADVVDGDTILVEGSVAVRLHGIDAPETLQTCERDEKSYDCGKHATAALARLIAGRPVRCELVGRDDFKRALGVCFVAGTEINAVMVKQGWALAFVKYSDAYTPQQTEAETAKAGIWGGTFINPGDWRERKAEEVKRDCPIKGNISAKGERIYHMPFDLSHAISPLLRPYQDRRETGRTLVLHGS
jgi:endonuclease YncB( thermonuclease family)